jgi:hypothetical protein
MSFGSFVEAIWNFTRIVRASVWIEGQAATGLGGLFALDKVAGITEIRNIQGAPAWLMAAAPQVSTANGLYSQRIGGWGIQPHCGGTHAQVRHARSVFRPLVQL